MKRLLFLGRVAAAVPLVLVFGCYLTGDMYTLDIYGKPEPTLDAATQYQINAIIGAKYPSHEPDGYDKLFAGLNNDQLRLLKGHAPWSIELQCAWEEVRRSIPEEKTEAARPVDAVRLKQLVALLEGRLHVTLPIWWKATLLSAQSYCRTNVFFSARDKQRVDFKINGASQLTMEGDRTILTVEGRSVTLPEPLIPDHYRLEYGFMSALLNENVAYVAVYGVHSDGFRMYCIDRKTGQTRWVTDVLARGRSVCYVGPSFERDHMVSISEVDHKVLVFGVATDTVYVEAFDPATGVALCRFSTSY